MFLSDFLIIRLNSDVIWMEGAIVIFASNAPASYFTKIRCFFIIKMVYYLKKALIYGHTSRISS